MNVRLTEEAERVLVALAQMDGVSKNATVFGDDAYPDRDTKAAVLLESIVRNHPLVDGNKRLAWVTAVVFYGINGLALRAPEDPAYDLVISVAEGGLTYTAVAAQLASWVAGPARLGP